MRQIPRTRQHPALTPGHVAPLRLIRGGMDEAVLRRKQFEAAHPEIAITPPGVCTCLWTARRHGTILASGYQLGALLDTLGWLLGQQP
jgi:hypothetical protein